MEIELIVLIVAIATGVVAIITAVLAGVSAYYARRGAHATEKQGAIAERQWNDFMAQQQPRVDLSVFRLLGGGMRKRIF